MLENGLRYANKVGLLLLLKILYFVLLAAFYFFVENHFCLRE